MEVDYILMVFISNLMMTLMPHIQYHLQQRNI
jgi:hypothetical protein